MLERICPVEAFSIVPRSLAGGCPTPPGHRDVTEKRILASGRHGKAHSGRGLSRKGAFYDPRTNQTAVFGEALEQNALFGLAAIEGRVQSAPFREVRRSGQAWGQRVYTDRRKRPLGAVLEHLCTLLQRKPRRVERGPRPPWRAGGVPSLAPSPLVGKTSSARAPPPLAWRLC